MNILVCVKQVPDTTEIKIDPVKKTLIRTGVPSIVNPFDAYALELAARLKDQNGGRVTILCMGPPQAEAAIRSCLAVGGDEGFLVSGREFGGSDTLATSYIISTAVRYLEEKKGEPFDVIFCGKQAIDGDTGQVGPEVAEHLGYAQVTCTTDITVEDGKLHVRRDTDEGYDVVEAPSPVVITVTKTAYEPRMSNIRAKLAATRAAVPVIAFNDLMGIDAERIGLKGSPTKVKKTFTPEVTSNCVFLTEESAALSAGRLAEALKKTGAI